MDRNKEIEELFAEYVDRLNSGEPIDRAQVREEHPNLADELLPLLEDFIEAAELEPASASLGTLGDYTLRREIGRGGMGVVYEAWQGSLDRQVALKVLPAGIAVDNKAFLRFMREAKTAAQLNHQNVVSVYGMGVEQNTPYYSMEFVEGETLSQILAKVKDAEPETETPFGKKDSAGYFEHLARAFADVADGLQHAHSKGVTHRDIKPSNLILDGEGRLRILDFGLARLEGQESLTLSGDVMGTPLYMSPEQARRKKIAVDHRTDVYSLGATLYEATCGRPPFRGKDHADTLSQIIERDPVEPRKVNPRVPRDLETIVLKCLRKEHYDRYGTAEALAQDLKRLVRGDAVEARPVPLGSKVRRMVIVHRRSLLAAVLIALVASLALSLVSLLNDRSRIAEPDPLDVDSTLNLAYRVRAEGKLGEAEQLLESMLQRAPRSPKLRLALADLLASHGKEDRALHELASAFSSVDPATSSPAQTQLSAFLIYDTAPDLSPLDSMIADTRQRGRSDLSSTAKTALGLCYLHAPRQKDPVRALELVRQAVEEASNPAPHQLAAMVIVLRESGLLEEAEKAYRALIELLCVDGSIRRGRASHGPAALLEDFSESFHRRWVISQQESGKATVWSSPGKHGDPEVHVKGTETVSRSVQRWIDLDRLDSDDPVYSHGSYRIRLRSNVPGCHVGLVLRRSKAKRGGYRIALVPSYGSCVIERINPSSPIGEVKIPSLQDSFGEDWVVEASMIGDDISVKLWCPSKEPEPDTPQLVKTDGWHRSGEVALKVVAWWDRADTRIDATFSEIAFTPYIPGFRATPGILSQPR